MLENNLKIGFQEFFLQSINKSVIVAYDRTFGLVGKVVDVDSLKNFINKNKTNILSCLMFDRNNFRIKMYYPATKIDKQNSFNQIFQQEMKSFSNECGMQKLALIFLIALQTNDLNKLRIFTINETTDQTIDKFANDIEGETYLNIPTVNNQHKLNFSAINKEIPINYVINVDTVTNILNTLKESVVTIEDMGWTQYIYKCNNKNKTIQRCID